MWHPAAWQGSHGVAGVRACCNPPVIRFPWCSWHGHPCPVTAGRPQAISLPPVHYQVWCHRSVCLESGGRHSCHSLCLFSAPLPSVLHSWALPAHLGAEWLLSPDPAASPQAPMLLRYPKTGLCSPGPPIPHVLSDPHTDPGQTQGPARLGWLPFSRGLWMWGGGTVAPHSIPVTCLYPHVFLGDNVSAAISVPRLGTLLTLS